jgi:hypothetical protein
VATSDSSLDKAMSSAALGARVVLLDPLVELRRLRFNLAMPTMGFEGGGGEKCPRLRRGV